MASSDTAINRIAPENINLSAALAPERSRPFPKDPITRAPKIAFHTLPRPPKRDVPPMTAAPIASSNNGPPANALKETEAYRDAPTIPPIAAIPPTIPNAASLTFFIEKPARLADSLLPPTANKARPNGVDVVIQLSKTVKQNNIITIRGTPLYEFKVETNRIEKEKNIAILKKSLNGVGNSKPIIFRLVRFLNKNQINIPINNKIPSQP